MATGGLDVFAADMNCTVPTLGATCAAHGTLLIPGQRPGRRRRRRDADRLRSGQRRRLRRSSSSTSPSPTSPGARRSVRRTPELRTGDAVAGFSTESILGALGGSLDPLLDVIKNGTLKGVAGLVSCTTLRDSGQDSMTVADREGTHRQRRAGPGHGLRQRRPAGRRSGDGRGEGARRPRPQGRLRAPRHPAGPQLRHLHRHRPHHASRRAPSRTLSASTCRRCLSWQRRPSTWSRRPPSTPWRHWPSACTCTSTRCPS